MVINKILNHLDRWGALPPAYHRQVARATKPTACSDSELTVCEIDSHDCRIEFLPTFRILFSSGTQGSMPTVSRPPSAD